MSKGRATARPKRSRTFRANTERGYQEHRATLARVRQMNARKRQEAKPITRYDFARQLRHQYQTAQPDWSDARIEALVARVMERNGLPMRK